MSDWALHESEPEGRHLYRFIDTATENGVNVYRQEYRVVRETPCGVWIDDYSFAKGRFVLLGTRKQFAHETPDEAAQSFLARKKRQVGILTHQLYRAKDALRMAEEMVSITPKDGEA